MITEIEQRRQFRLSQCRDKLQLAALMMAQHRYNEAVIYSYLSMFYSVRLLLIEHDDDSDDHDKILELEKRYYEPCGWTGIDIMALLKDTKSFRDSISKSPGHRVSEDDAEKFYSNAMTVMNEVLQHLKIKS
ncbi:MAG: HEPN domain-containing protein [Spirochaetes bacterium]|nr:MAG: HEPN domain-containing protein [Spirochaetota bacterium]